MHFALVLILKNSPEAVYDTKKYISLGIYRKAIQNFAHVKKRFYNLNT